MKNLHARSRGSRLAVVLLFSSGPAGWSATNAADPLIEPPFITSAPGPEYQQEARAGAMIIGMDRTTKGRIWGCWTGTGDNTESYFILATSDDGGTTWSKPRLVIDPQEIPGRPPRSSLIGNLWTDPTGRLWLFFDQHMKGFATTNWYMICENPDAAEPRWSKPVYFADGSTLNKPTILRGGEWLLPVSLLTPGRIDPARPDDPARQTGAHVYVSTDQGRTWARRGGTRIPDADVNHNEHMFVELRDGRLWMLLRTRYGIAESHSADGGRTWSEPAPSRIQNPSTRFFLRRLASGRLLLVKNGPIDVRTPGRSHLTAFLSEDEGRSWGQGLLLDERSPLSYPDGFERPDGLVQILYDWNRHTDAEILMAAFREADIRAGRLVSPDARVRHVVDKARAPELSESHALDRTRLPAINADAKLDRLQIAHGPTAGGEYVTDVQLRASGDGTWSLLVMTADAPNAKAATVPQQLRSRDEGRTWSAPAKVALPFPGTPGPVELIPGQDGAGSVLLGSSHGKDWADGWRSWVVATDAGLARFQQPVPLPSPLGARTFVRNHLVTRDGRILVPFQHYPRAAADRADPAFQDPRCGVLESRDGGRTWKAFGEIRLQPVKRAFDWTESHLVELAEGRIVMLVRQPGAMGLLYRAVSADGGRTWPATAELKRAPTGGTATLFGLGNDTVAMIHNYSTRLALWVSFDGMKTWPYQRTFPHATCPGPKESMQHAHGFVSPDRAWLHVAYIDNQHRAIVYSAKLPGTR